MPSRQIREIEAQTPHAVTVPGAVDAWCGSTANMARRPLAELLEPAARAAEDGYVVTPRVAWDWQRNQWKLHDPVTAAVMLPGGKPPAVGDRMSNPALAAHAAPHRPRGPRRRFTKARSWRDIVAPPRRSWAGCTSRRISPPSAANGSSRSRRPIAATTSTNARRTGRAWRR